MQSEEEENYANEMKLQPLLSRKDMKQGFNLHKRRQAHLPAHQFVKNIEMNKQLDSSNTAKKWILTPTPYNSPYSFQHFMNKNRYLKDRHHLFKLLRDLLIERKITNNCENRISSKSSNKQILVVRFLSIPDKKINVMIIQDELTRQKIQIASNFVVWIGMICAIQCIWIENIYKLVNIIDLSQTRNVNLNLQLSYPLKSYQILFVKAPLSNYDNFGMGIFEQQLREIKANGIIIDCIVIMGPLISINNPQNDQMQNTYEEQFNNYCRKIIHFITYVMQNANIVLVPSIQDITNFYPCPQPPFDLDIQDPKLFLTGNPGSILLQDRLSQVKIDLINEDILKYIDDNKVGQPIQKNLETYLKQPFTLTNTTQGIFDEVNLLKTYNQGNFGNIIVFSSVFHPVSVNQVKGRLFINIGSLGIEQNEMHKHYMVKIGIYEGSSSVASRTKVQFMIG